MQVEMLLMVGAYKAVWVTVKLLFGGRKEECIQKQMTTSITAPITGVNWNLRWNSD